MSQNGTTTSGTAGRLESQHTSVGGKSAKDVLSLVLEKSLLGSLPTHFLLRGESVPHPIQWYREPKLSRVYFDDGSVILIDQEQHQKLHPDSNGQGGYTDEPAKTAAEVAEILKRQRAAGGGVDLSESDLNTEK